MKCLSHSKLKLPVLTGFCASCIVSRPGSRAINKRMLVMLRSGLWYSAEIDLMASARPERSVSRPVVCQVEVLAFSVMVRFRAYARDNA